MISLSMENLIDNFRIAEEWGQRFVAIRVHIEGFPEDEIIINERGNFYSKLEYYKATYDDLLNHKFARGIRIVGFMHGDSYAEIQASLVEW